AAGAVSIPLPTQAQRRLGTSRHHRRATFGVSPGRRKPHRMGTQHPAGGPVAILDHVSELSGGWTVTIGLCDSFRPPKISWKCCAFGTPDAQRCALSVVERWLLPAQLVFPSG